MPRNGPAYSQIPIPTYDEATTSHSPSSQTHFGANGSVEERVGLIAPTPSARNHSNDGYRPPTVESARSSFESVTTLSSARTSHDEREVRRDMEEFEIDDSGSSSRRRHQYSRNKLLASITNSFRSMSFPSISSPFRGITRRLPAWPDHLKPSLPILARLVGITLLLGFVYALGMKQADRTVTSIH